MFAPLFRRARSQEFVHLYPSNANRLPPERGLRKSLALPFVCVLGRSERSAVAETLTRFLRVRRLFAEATDYWNQAVDLRLIQGSSEGRHIVFALFDLGADFVVR